MRVSRRTFAASVTALAASCGVAFAAEFEPAFAEPWGLMTVDSAGVVARAGVKFKVLLDGRDVTAGCFVADDKRGYVGLYRKDASGRFHLTWPSCGHTTRVVGKGCPCETFESRIDADIHLGHVQFVKARSNASS